MDLCYISKIFLLAYIALQGTAAKNGLLYEYGNATDSLSKNEDYGSVAIKFTVNFPLFGNTYSSLYLCNKGLLTFTASYCVYATADFPIKGSVPFIAPFWADLYNVLSGDIYYRQSNDSTLLANVTKDINKYFPEVTFSAKWVFITTWDKVPRFPGAASQANTFQVVLATDGTSSFVLFNYAIIQWSFLAVAGLNSGNITGYYQLNKPKEISFNWTNSSNVNYPGRWAFKVDKSQPEGMYES
ncbi:sushi, nidogen and EGF-like domain-containing protein 1 [Xenopus laevis]|uniref:Sushi, nidogen and EGF-like domain-containing protein 1 n=1 Tax=Xenopus laevis TaxID=8355 RepID=A0A8J1L810_XENLA|nr:sushi, nidogen and EGF-like domain-containing protein 1 [Xenopus laevis]